MSNPYSPFDRCGAFLRPAPNAVPDAPFERRTSATHAKGKTALSQDPHPVREIAERILGAAIGREVRGLRQQRGLTVADLAAANHMSIGMLSKIKTGSISSSLATLQALSHAFSAAMTGFFKG